MYILKQYFKTINEADNSDFTKFGTKLGPIQVSQEYPINTIPCTLYILLDSPLCCTLYFILYPTMYHTQTSKFFLNSIRLFFEEHCPTLISKFYKLLYSTLQLVTFTVGQWVQCTLQHTVHCSIIVYYSENITWRRVFLK